MAVANHRPVLAEFDDGHRRLRHEIEGALRVALEHQPGLLANLEREAASVRA
jgi:hypothetical protein